MENSPNHLFLTEEAKDYLKESAKWSKLLAIIGFVGIGLMVLLAIFIGLFTSFMPTNSVNGGQMGVISYGFVSFIYIVFAALYFLPVYYLFKYAQDTKNAIISNDSELLERGFEFLKSHHKFLGIMMLVILSLYALLLIVAVVAGMAAAASSI